MREGKTVSLVDYLEVLVKRRKFIILNVFIITFVAVVLSLVLPSQFTAKATLLPPNPEQNALLGIMSTNIPTGLTSLARMGGMSLGLASPSDLFAAIMTSERIQREIIKKYRLKEVFQTTTMDDTYKYLNEITKLTVSPEGIILIAVTYTDKYLATDIANSYVEELDEFNTETAMTVGRKFRIFIEQRLRENEDSLAMAEQELRRFQEEHQTIALDVEIASAIETIAKLKSEIISREVQKGVMALGSNINNPYISSIEKELRELKKQLSKIEFGTPTKDKKEFGAGFAVPFSELPEISLQYARLLRDVAVQEAIYELLTQQYEQAKIMELKDTPTVQILDKAVPPEKRSLPVRRLVVLLGFLIGVAFGICVAFGLEYIDRMKKGQTKMSHKWIAIFSELRGDLRQILKKLHIFSK